jgi:ABC-type cobalt transport system substrate-binding protein
MAKLERRHVLQILIVALAIVLGLVVMVMTGINNVDFVDTKDYVYTAATLVQKGYYPDSYFFPLFRPPLYPLFLAAIWMISPGNIVAVKVIQILIHGVTCWLVFKIALEITKDETISFLGALFFVINPLFLYMAVGIQSESIHAFLFTLAMFFLVRMVMSDKVKISYAIWSGVALGLAALNKPSALGVGAVLAGTLFLLMWRRKNGFTGAATVAAAMFLTLVPWTIYIWQTRGELIVISDAGGYNLWVGNHPRLIPLFRGEINDTAAADAENDNIIAERDKLMAEWRVTKNYDNLSLKQRESLWRAAAIDRFVQNPGQTAELFALKFYILWRPFANNISHSIGKSLMAAAVLVPLYIFGLWGLLRLWKDRQTRKVVWLFIATAVSVTAIHVIILTSMRYRLPYVDPMLTILAAVGLAALLARVLGKTKFLPSFAVRENAVQ